MAHSENTRQSGRAAVEGYFARVELGAGASQSLIGALNADLSRIRLGRVTGATGNALALSIASDSPAALAEVARILARLKAPPGSWIGNAECPRMIEVARLNGTHKVTPEQVFRGSVSAGRYGALALYPHAEARLRAVLARSTARLN